MSDYKLSLFEQETIILYNQGDEDVEIYTHDPALMKKLNLRTDVVTVKSVNKQGGYTYIVPKEKLSILIKPIRTEKQRKACIKNVEKARQKSPVGKIKKK